MSDLTSTEKMHQPNKSGVGGYKLLDPRQKYNRAFCTEEEIEIAEHFRGFVDRELMPYRHDLEGGWHKDAKLAKETVHRLYGHLEKSLSPGLIG